MSRRFLPCQAPGQEAIAPSAMLREGSGTREASVTSCSTPSPWQTGQAPTAVLGEKASESRCSSPGGRSPDRDRSIRNELEIMVSVPTVDRPEGLVLGWASATAGGRPVIDPTSGSGSWRRSRRA